jgi:hypothetical protein
LVRRTARTVLAVVLAAATLAGQPRRIVSTAPSITELLFALGLGDRVVGVTRFSQKKTIIGDYINPNIEAIASLRPDLVIVQQNPVRLTERLNALHLHTLEIDQQNAPLADSIYKSIRIVGEATGTRQRAAQLADSIRAGLESVRARSAPLKRTRVMFVVGRAPARLDGLIVVGDGAHRAHRIRGIDCAARAAAPPGGGSSRAAAVFVPAGRGVPVRLRYTVAYRAGANGNPGRSADGAGGRAVLHLAAAIAPEKFVALAHANRAERHFFSHDFPKAARN